MLRLYDEDVEIKDYRVLLFYYEPSASGSPCLETLTDVSRCGEPDQGTDRYSTEFGRPFQSTSASIPIWFGQIEATPK